ncbi:heme peroxidase [Artemisia annua]|uniref:peroxidase n=1 Tax=Artemisia annua TaxID=35608 RepID=A0A2U1NZI5_ARTAN|nr:heme peroxidase [Artemisia annua]
MARSIIMLMVLISVMAIANASYGSYLYPQFYDHSCPQAKNIVQSVVAKAVAKEARMAASLLRLHFHDCFVKGCDASILLDNSGTIISEKGSVPNRNSARGFEVIDEIKAALEKACPQTVSCADIMALAARDSTVLAGGPSWEVPLGRRDSLGASLSGSNQNIPAPNNTFQTILTKFKLKGLDIVDFVTLSGSHTIGNARCTSFRQRLYNNTGNGKPDLSLDQSYAAQLRQNCPRSGGDQNLFVMDPVSPTKFDNNYYKNLIAAKGLLSSDEILFTQNQQTMQYVKQYAANQELFFQQFAKSMVKMGNITPLTASHETLYMITHVYTILEEHMLAVDTSHKLLIFDPSLLKYGNKQLTLRTVDCDAPNVGFTTVREVTYSSLPYPHSFLNSLYVLSSFDGLVCLASPLTKELALLNPLTGAFKSLPENSYSPHFYNRYSDVLGFYMDSFSDDYKLLHIVVSKGFLGAYVYSLKMDSWKKIEYLVDSIDHRSDYSWTPATLLGQCLYFVVWESSSEGLFHES